jgi:hypothetical protein
MQFLTPNCCTVFVILHHHANIISFIFVLQLNKLKEYIYIYIYTLYTCHKKSHLSSCKRTQQIYWQWKDDGRIFLCSYRVESL